MMDEGQQIDPLQLTAAALQVTPRRAERQRFTNSGKSIYRVFLDGDRSLALRISDRPRTFDYTAHNLSVLRGLGLPVPSVLAAGRTPSGGSYIVLDWIDGQDLLEQLPGITQVQMTGLAEQVVQYQRQIAGLPPAGMFGWAPIGQRGSVKNWTDIFGPAPALPPADDGTVQGGLRARICSARAVLETYFSSLRPLCFLDDLNIKNVLVENGALTGIIDVDYVCYGDPLLAVGTTLASIAADLGGAGMFYGEELVRLWNPSAIQHRAIRFYAALWAFGCLNVGDNAGDARRQANICRAVDEWLSMCESERFEGLSDAA
jgi:aminoglycoside phosphotransferase (APT) family kinase protein